MKKAIIVGSRSQDGIFLKNYLLELKYKIIGICRDYTEHCQKSIKSIKSIKINIFSKKEVENIITDENPDEIYYLCGYNHSSESSIDDNKDSLDLANNIHFISPMIFLNVIKKSKNNIKFFYACSSHIFGATSKYPQNELTKIQPITEYAITKASGLFGCQKFRSENVFASVGILYSHISEYRSDKFLCKKISSAVARINAGSEEIITVGNLDTLLDWGYAKDYVEAMHAILQLSDPDDFIISSGEKHTVKEFLILSFKYVGLDYRNYINVNKNLTKRNLNYLIGNPTKIKKLCGWESKTKFVDLVNKLVQHEIDSL